jgi:hypothetical protein
MPARRIGATPPVQTEDDPALAGTAPDEATGPQGDPDEARRQRIAERAYRRAERRNFAPGGELDDWLAAEAEERDDTDR